MKKYKKLVIILLCFAMILPLATVFEICGEETTMPQAENTITTIPDEDFENLTSGDLIGPNWSVQTGLAAGGADISVAPDGTKPTIEEVKIPLTKAILSSGTTTDFGRTITNDNLPTSTAEVRFNLYVASSSWKGVLITIGNNTTKHSSVAFFKPSESSQYSSYGNAIVAAYSGSGSTTVAPSFHPAYIPIAKEKMPDGEYMEMGKWYNIRIALTKGSSTAKFFINNVEVGTITANSSISVINSLTIQRVADWGGTNNIYVDNVAFYAPSSSTPYYFEDFEDYDTGSAPTDKWDKGSYKSLTIATVDSINQAIYFNKPSGTNPSTSITLSEDLPSYTNEINFDAYIEAADYKGIALDFKSSSTLKARLNFYGASNYSANSAYANKVMLAYWNASHSSKLETSYDNRIIPALETSELLNFNEWNNFSLKWNKGDTTASLYINGKLVCDTVTLTNGDVINQISILPMNTDGYGKAYIDNINIYGDNSETPYFSNDFSNETVNSPVAGWTVTDPAVNVGQILSYPSRSFDVEVKGTNALRVWQKSSSANMIMNYRYFQPTTKFTVSYDYMPTIASTKGHYLPIFSGDTMKYYIRVCKATDTDTSVNFTDGKTATIFANIPLNSWCNIKIEYENNVAKVYINNVYKGTLKDSAPTATAINSIVFGTVSTQWVTEEYYIDNLKFTGAYNIEVKDMTTEFIDEFNSENTTDYTYSGSGSYETIDGKLLVDGDVQITRKLPCNTTAGKFGFTLNTDDPTDIIFDILYGDSTAVSVKIGENGAIYYKREATTWNMCTNEGVIKPGTTNEIALDAPKERNVNYFNVYINGELEGTAIYHNSFIFMDGLRITTPKGSSVTIDDVFAAESSGILTTPDRGEEKDPIIYVSEIIEGTRAMYDIYDANPGTSTLLYADETSEIVSLDYYRNSIGVDLGSIQSANAIRIIGEPDKVMKLNVADTSLWYSNDNENWDRAYGHTLNIYEEDGISSMLVEFTGITARYFKINYHMEDTPSTIAPTNLNESLRVERKIARQWGLAGTSMYALNDADPTATSMVVELNKKTDDGANNQFVYNVGDSIGINFGLHSNVEAIEIVANGLSSLGKDAFKLYYSLDNYDYYPIDDVILSRNERNGQDVYRFTFDNVKCGYLKLHNVSGGSITLDNLYDSLKAYSSIEVASGHFKGKGIGDDGGIHVLSDGTIVMSFVGFVSSAGDFDDCYSLCVQSTDGGYTWSPSWIDLQRREENMNLITFSYIKLEDGAIGVIYSEKTNLKNDLNAIVCYTHLRRSYDNGRTWSEPIAITEGLFYAYTIQASGYRFTRLSTGRILAPINYSPNTSDTGGSDRSVSFVMYSDDDGYTWKMSKNTLALPHSALEPVITETTDGLLLMTLRTRSEGRIYQSLSTDDGITWSQPHVLSVDSPSSTNIVDTIPQTGDVLFIWNNEFATDNGRRNPLTMAISADNGLTYKNIRNIRQSQGTYPFADFYGRSVLIQSSAGLTVLDIADMYHTVMGNKTIEDLPKAATPNAKLKNGWLTDVSSTMKFSLDGGESWIFCGGTSVEIGDVTGGILVMDIGTHEYAPSDIQTIE